jgi:hypothetical protein
MTTDAYTSALGDVVSRFQREIPVVRRQRYVSRGRDLRNGIIPSGRCPDAVYTTRLPA